VKVTIETTGSHFTFSGAYLDHAMKNLIEQPPSIIEGIGHTRQFTNTTLQSQMVITIELTPEECAALPKEKEAWEEQGFTFSRSDYKGPFGKLGSFSE
jgi:hypothetical protein